MVDKAVKKIRPQDDELSRIQDNLADAVQQLLNQANQGPGQQLVLSPLMQQLRGPGTAYSVKTPALAIAGRPDGSYINGQPTVVIGTPAAFMPNGQPIAQKDAELVFLGQIILNGSATQNDGVVVIPQVSGPAFRVTNTSNSVNVFLVSTDGTCRISGNCFAALFSASGQIVAGTSMTCGTDFVAGGNVYASNNVTATNTVQGANVVSGAGFTNTLDCGYAWNSGVAANTFLLTNRFMLNSGGLGGTGVAAWRFKPPRSGSIVGYCYSQTSSNAGVQFLQLRKNGTNITTFTVGTGVGDFWASIPKNTYTFAAGDTLQTAVASNAANNFQASVQITIEMSA